MNTILGAKASAVIYSVVETARLNNFISYYYVNHLTEFPKFRDEKVSIYGKLESVITQVLDLTR